MNTITKIAISVLCLATLGCVGNPEVEKNVNGKHLVYSYTDTGRAYAQITWPDTDFCRKVLYGAHKAGHTHLKCERHDVSENLAYRGTFSCSACAQHFHAAANTEMQCQALLEVLSEVITINGRRNSIETETGTCTKQ